MSGIMHKIKEGIHEATRPKDNAATGTGVPEGTAGPHSSRVANAADPRIDSDLDNRAQHTHNANLTGTGTTGVGHTGSTNAGPHDSNIANKLDPRVDSDLDGSRNAGMNQTTHPSGRTVGTTHVGSTNAGTTTAGSTNAGPHDSNLLNKLDPRVDSDLDGSRNAGMNQTTHPSGHTVGTTRVGSTTQTGTTHTGSTNAGPHNSNLLNKLDPRVDSDLDGSRNAGMNQTTGPTGRPAGSAAYSGSTNAGPHDSNIANKLDPRVDSDLDGGRHMGMNQTTTAGGRPTGTTTTTAGTGTAHAGSTNAGPHNSNLLNKLDPRVDSDLDGSRNAGMNQTTRTAGY